MNLSGKPREGIEPPGNGSAVRRINHSATSAREPRRVRGLKEAGDPGAAVRGLVQPRTLPIGHLLM